MPDRLNLPPIPFAFERFFRIWHHLHRHRQTGMGLSRITWLDMDAYCNRSGDRISLSDSEALAIIDTEFFEAVAAAEKRREKPAGKAGKPRRPAR